MNEFDLIAKLKPLLATNDLVVTGAGDDCAVLELGAPDMQALFKTDAVVEGVHFAADTEPERIGRKALARCLSDIAAMGGTPVAAVVTLALPKEHDPERVLAIYRGLNRFAAQHQVAVVGGETTTNPGGLLLNIALLGTVPRGHSVLRAGTQAGDAIFVSGELGGSLAGRHLDFEPRLAEGRWLAESGFVHAMMDVSDGLAGDLPHLLAAGSRGDQALGAELLKSAIPISRAAKLRARENGSAKPAIVAALTDGEDFELLFTVAARDAVKLLDGWHARFPSVELSCIGKVTPRPGVFVCGEDGRRLLHAKGYEHFA